MVGSPDVKAWNRIFTDQHLKDIFLEKVKSRPSVGLDWITPELFEKSLDYNIDIILRKCNDGTYKYTRFREKLISKGAKKPPRCISIPTVRDKIVLSALNELLFEVYGRSVITQMPQVVISEISHSLNDLTLNSFIKADIKTFYASIDRKLLMKQLGKKIKKPEVYELIEKAINTNTGQPHIPVSVDISDLDVGIPEGLPISNALANLYLQCTDYKFNGMSNCRYWRYVDDILILTSDDCLQKLKESLKQDITSLSLMLHEDEGKANCGNVNNGFEFLGYNISPDRISVRRSSIIAFERSLETTFRRYSNTKNSNIKYLQWKINLKITGFILNENKYGWLFFYSQIDDLSCLSHLDWLIRTLSKRFSIKNVCFKSFMKTYHEITKALHTTTYIPNLDKMTIEEKKHIIQDIYGENIGKGTDDSYIDITFKRIMRKEIKDIQKDVQSFS